MYATCQPVDTDHSAMTPEDVHPLDAVPVLNMRGSVVALGPLRDDLLPTYEHWLGDPSQLAVIDRRYRPSRPDWIHGWYRKVSQSRPDAQVYTVWSTRDMAPIGIAALQEINDRSRTAELGIVIGNPACRDAIHLNETHWLLLRIAFDILSLENVMTRVAQNDVLARTTCERLGFNVIGVRRAAEQEGGRRRDTVLMDYTSADYAQRLEPGAGT